MPSRLQAGALEGPLNHSWKSWLGCQTLFAPKRPLGTNLVYPPSPPPLRQEPLWAAAAPAEAL